jgi:hypothetical protein
VELYIHSPTRLHGVCSVKQSAGTTLLFTFTFTASSPALEPTRPPMQWVPGDITLGIRRPGREANHSPPSSPEVKNAWSNTSTLLVRLHDVVLS